MSAKGILGHSLTEGYWGILYFGPVKSEMGVCVLNP